ncbi:telomere-protecting terminal protein Tpg [Streptomyces sp. NPDC056983]|uniref:telomere-protecting terminal protein Tpg n=1 Tax=Streptomyces sp. NPDC056983 TaxID=3345987 RepID=UPI00363E2813
MSAGTVQEALDRADSRHWTRNPPRSLQARLGYLLKQHHGDTVALANLLSLTPTELDALRTAKQTPAEHPVHQAAEREVVRAWQPQVRRRAHATIVANGGQMMVSFRARFGFAATAGSSDDPRLRYLTLHLEAPYPAALFDARHGDAPESELHALLGDALGASYFFQHRKPGPGENVALQDIDFLGFYF